MENKSNPKSQKTQKHLEAFLKLGKLQEIIEKSIFPDSNKNYLEGYISASEINKTSHITTPQSRKNYLSAQKKINNDISKLSSLSAIEKESYLNDVGNEELLSAVHDIKKLPQALLKCHIINNYNHCQTFIHEKGNSFAQSYSSNKGHTDITVSLFNKTFQTIKKSKGNLFNSTVLHGDHINLLGYFFAMSLESHQFRWIVVIGNNDFFAPQKEQETELQNQIKRLTKKIESIFMHCRYDDRIENIITVLDTISLPILIKDKRENTIYQNNAREELYDVNLSEYTSRYFELADGNELCLLEPIEHNDSTDIYHHYKVNLLGELLNTLKHELSNPLFGLHLSSEIMAAQCDEPESRELIEDIATRAERCQTIIKNFSKLYGDQDHKEVNVIELIQETMTLTKSETRGIGKTLTNNIDVNYLVTKTHPTSLSQVIFNLIINASQAIHLVDNKQVGEIIIECNYSNKQYEISVIDNGPGVPEHLKDSIFNSFFTTKKEGTGLGLSICANLIHKMDGIIKYSDRVDKKGSVFTIIFQ